MSQVGTLQSYFRCDYLHHTDIPTCCLRLSQGAELQRSSLHPYLLSRIGATTLSTLILYVLRFPPNSLGVSAAVPLSGSVLRYKLHKALLNIFQL